MLIVSILPANFLEVAQALLETSGEGKDEAKLRSAVSRSYYGALHQAITTADELDIPKPLASGMGTHLQVAQRLKNHSKPLARLAARLRTAKLTRCQADYDLKDDITPEEAALNVKKCHDIASDLQRMRPRTSASL